MVFTVCIRKPVQREDSNNAEDLTYYHGIHFYFFFPHKTAYMYSYIVSLYRLRIMSTSHLNNVLFQLKIAFSIKIKIQGKNVINELYMNE